MKDKKPNLTIRILLKVLETDTDSHRHEPVRPNGHLILSQKPSGPTLTIQY